MSTKAIGVDFDGGFDGGGGGSTKSSSKGLCPCGCDHPLSKGQHRCLHSAESFHENNKAKVEYQSINKSRKSAAAPSFEWKRINFKVGEKKILDDCWGRVTAGTVCAILGPSGAGKSSLLNVLAGRSANAPGVTISAAVSSCHYTIILLTVTVAHTPPPTRCAWTGSSSTPSASARISPT
mmetsp:Transcript_8906/g.19565  ORF Transcript_8906/g.19565 Transcript_8906/m.19565 type:complete len:180 (-) Transcript_8906:3-542(-)